MASAPKASLPVLYKDLKPLNSSEHGDWHARTVDKAPWVAGQHAIPLTVEEFPAAQRSFPIVFSSGERSVPLALMGLNEGVNVFFDDEGAPREGTVLPYIPAYIRRYPFLLAKLDKDSDNLSLCFDPTSDLVGKFDDGQRLFNEDKEPSEHTKGLLQFCEKFEEAGNRTQAFMQELNSHDLLMDGEIAINRADNPDQPFIYRGFRMVNQEKLRELRGDQLRKWNENGLLPLVFAHLFSLDLMRTIFARQVDIGKGPQGAAGANGAAKAGATQV
ncbi:SapC family protein [Aurantiacibacter poecillastricola]|uniref:SapC family protein n=1 Tax=Aurantiacibacter poecillastricola TaxID=3064385 RepID=UPI00273F1470|nr:SapC family protein [Aurantiacibacter sp. 219JJ12-13]MDP5261723.1 SapC family protein [Aurantiacibacter sp. 219JJ12-13]